jgi:tubulin--tyrosine ligase
MFYKGNKKALFYSLRKYYQLIGLNPFNFIPVTFHISKGMNDLEY